MRLWRKARRQLMRLLGLARKAPRRIMLLGGGRTAELVAVALESRGSEVVIVERDDGIRVVSPPRLAFDLAADLTGIVLATVWVAFSVQIRMEEEHLGRMHGPAYDRYRATVPRWIGLPLGAAGNCIVLKPGEHEKIDPALLPPQVELELSTSNRFRRDDIIGMIVPEMNWERKLALKSRSLSVSKPSRTAAYTGECTALGVKSSPSVTRFPTFAACFLRRAPMIRTAPTASSSSCLRRASRSTASIACSAGW